MVSMNRGVQVHYQNSVLTKPVSLRDLFAQYRNALCLNILLYPPKFTNTVNHLPTALGNWLIAYLLFAANAGDVSPFIQNLHALDTQHWQRLAQATITTNHTGLTGDQSDDPNKHHYTLIGNIRHKAPDLPCAVHCYGWHHLAPRDFGIL